MIKRHAQTNLCGTFSVGLVFSELVAKFSYI